LFTAAQTPRKADEPSGQPRLAAGEAGLAETNPAHPHGHRVGVAGGDFERIFAPEIHKVLYNATNGVPRDLCVLCDAAMLNALAMNRRTVDGDAVARAFTDLSFKGWDRMKAA
jgi:hypothetical protein